MIKFSVSVLIMLSVTVFLFSTGCKKKETIAVDNESQSVVDNSVAEQEFLNVPPTTQQLAINTKGVKSQSRGLADACDTLTKNSGDTLFGKAGHIDPTYTLNLSNIACGQIMPDGKLRSGFLTIRFTNKINVPGARMIIKFNQYKARAIQYSCDSMVITTVNSNTLATTFNVKLFNGVCSTSDWAIKYNFDRTITHYFKGNPSGTSPYTSTYGSANGVNRQGKAFSVNIPSSNPLIKYRNCEYISKGTLELSPDGFKARVVDYGDGTCDEDATFMVNGNTIAFKLK